MGRALTTFAVVVSLGVLGGAVYVAVRNGPAESQPPQGCAAHAAGRTVTMATGQAENAALIAAVADRRGLPARAVSIALTAAIQESKLENVRYGDSDSLGLFQQRPSQGWGSPHQVLNRVYATNAFFNELVKVPGYQTMAIARAAQAVQRSAYPSAYALHASDGRVLASALTGNSEAAFTCTVDTQSLPPQSPQGDGLTARAATLRAAMHGAYGVDAAAASTGHGRRLDVAFVPGDTGSAVHGWALAHYLVADAVRLHVRRVAFDGKVWTAGPGSTRGWHRLGPRAPADTAAHPTRAVVPASANLHVDVW